MTSRSKHARFDDAQEIPQHQGGDTRDAPRVSRLVAEVEIYSLLLVCATVLVRRCGARQQASMSRPRHSLASGESDVSSLWETGCDDDDDDDDDVKGWPIQL